MKTSRQKLSFKEMPSRYGDLVKLLPPRPIHDAVDEANVEEVVLAMAGHKLTRDQDDYLELMSDLLMKYQDSVDPWPLKLNSPLDRLQYLLEESGTTPTKLAEILNCSQSLVSLVLTGKRELSKENVVKLAKHFKVEAGYFL